MKAFYLLFFALLLLSGAGAFLEPYGEESFRKDLEGLGVDFYSEKEVSSVLAAPQSEGAVIGFGLQNGFQGMMVILFQILGVVAYTGFLLVVSSISYRKYHRRRMVEDLNHITETVRSDMRTGAIDEGEALIDLVEQVRGELDEEKFEKADEDMEELKSKLREKIND